MSNKKCVFIVGCPRSGTTFLGSMLGNTPECITTPESQFIPEVYRRLSTNRRNVDSRIKDCFLKNFRFQLWNIQDSFKEMEVHGRDILTLRNAVLAAVELYAQKQNSKDWGAWIDHTPSHARHIHLLREMFPDSYFIHLVRDGRGVFSSVKNLDWGPSTVINAAEWWVSKVAAGLAAQVRTPRVITVRYEDLLQNHEPELVRICEFVGISYQQSMLAGGGFVLPEYTKRQHKFVGKKAEVSLSHQWKEKLNPRQIEIFESIAGPVLQYLGYELLYGINASSPTNLERISEQLVFSPWSWILNRRRNAARKRRGVAGIQ